MWKYVLLFFIILESFYRISIAMLFKAKNPYQLMGRGFASAFVYLLVIQITSKYALQKLFGYNSKIPQHIPSHITEPHEVIQVIILNINFSTEQNKETTNYLCFKAANPLSIIYSIKYCTE